MKTQSLLMVDYKLYSNSRKGIQVLTFIKKVIYTYGEKYPKIFTYLLFKMKRSFILYPF